ncbi:ABC transporter substrate-binding protein [Leucobacter celer]|uniref:ABC transporter substrate-binding protein n=1 Tax=Leucobacter celer TaxID=668625 RepID=UPI0006A7A963|nr:ABC transporter substrate-binding protein [Leucobacter celer]
MTKNNIFQEIRNAEMKRRAFLGLVGAGGALTLAGCAAGGTSPSTQGGGAGKTGGLFRIGTEGGDAASPLDPHKSFGDRMNSFICTSFYEQINIVGNSGAIENVLAKELTSDAAGLVWTLVLKEGVEFHNGKTLDTDDVIFSIDRILDPELGATAFSQFNAIKDMRAVDKSTLEITLKAPQSWFDLNIADGGIMGLVPADFDLENPVSTGPFKLVSYDKNGLAQFERFDNYHGEVAKFDELEIHGIVDDDTRINALLSGQLDAAKIPPIQAARVEAGNGYLATNAPSSYIQPMTMKLDGDGPFASHDARQAMRYAINRQQVLDAVYGGRGRLASDLYGASDPNLADLERSQDLAKAKDLAEKAGLTSAGTIPITVTASYEALAKVMAENAKEIGVDLRVDVLEPGAYWEGAMWDFSAEAFPLTHVLPMAALVDGPEPGFNMTGFSDPEFDEYFTKASEATDEAEHAAAVEKLQEIQFERGGYIVPVYINTVYGHSDKVVGMIEEDASGLGINRSLNTLSFSA